MAKTAKRLTYLKALALFGGNHQQETGMYSLHNTGTQYEIRDESGLVVAAFEEYLDATAFIRRRCPSVPEWAVGFAPQPDERATFS